MNSLVLPVLFAVATSAQSSSHNSFIPHSHPSVQCPQKPAFMGNGVYCLNNGAGSSLYYCSFPGALPYLVRDQCESNFNTPTVPYRTPTSPRPYPYQSTTTTAATTINRSSQWLPRSVLDGRQCTSTYATSNNAISCADGTSWTDNEFGEVSYLGLVSVDLRPEVSVDAWPEVAVDPRPAVMWYPYSILDKKSCMSTYAAFNNVISCADGSTWTDNEAGEVRPTNAMAEASIPVQSDTSFFGAQKSAQVWYPYSVLDDRNCRSTRMVSNNVISCADGGTWTDNEKQEVRPTNAIAAAQVEENPIAKESTQVWYPYSILDQKSCMSTYAAFNNVINCADGSTWTDNEAGEVRPTNDIAAAQVKEPPVVAKESVQVWYPRSVLDNRNCASTMMVANNAINCADGTTWTDNEAGEVRPTNAEAFASVSAAAPRPPYSSQFLPRPVVVSPNSSQ